VVLEGEAFRAGVQILDQEAAVVGTLEGVPAITRLVQAVVGPSIQAPTKAILLVSGTDPGK